MKVTVDSTKCMGHALCAGQAPTVFDFDDEGYAVVVVEHPEGDELEAAEQAALSCPEQAITVE